MKLSCENKNIILRMQESRNPHILITGQSGMGKSTLMRYLCRKFYEENIHVVILGSETEFLDDEEPFSREEALKIQVENDQICLDSYLYGGSAGILNLMEKSLKIRALDDRNKAKEIVESAILNCQKSGSEVISLLSLLEEMERHEVALKEVQSMVDFACTVDVVFTINPKAEKNACPRIFQIDANGLSESESVQLFELLMHEIFLYKRSQREPGAKVMVFIDEFQNYYTGNESAIGRILTEGRKYNLGLVLATQYIEENFSPKKVNKLYQADNIFMFCPTDADANHIIRHKCGGTLSGNDCKRALFDLQRGECMLFGPNSVEGKDIVDWGPRKLELVLD